ncbi:hypothetical protein ACP70R_027609 [Stipagrostis hirtigluma subsp. patula]
MTPAAAGDSSSPEAKAGHQHKHLRIAVIHPDLGIGGAERLIVDVSCQLTAAGHNVHVFTLHHTNTRCFEETVCYYEMVLGKWCISVNQIELFNHQVSVSTTILPLRNPHHQRLYFIATSNHTTILWKLYRRPIDMIEEVTTGMADLILANSKFTASTFSSTFHGLHARGIKPAVLYPAVSVEQFDEPRAYKLNFLSINQFERKKNLDLAISAFALLHSVGSMPSSDGVHEATLTIAGGYDKRLKETVEHLEELRRLAVTEEVSDQVTFVTSCSTSERNELLSNCLCLTHSKDEHFGIVPLEAMAAKKPVIACNSGGPVETVINELTGFLCEPSAIEFSKAMSRLVNDPDLAIRMGKEARNHVVHKFSTMIFGDLLNSYILNVYHQRIE